MRYLICHNQKNYFAISLEYVFEIVKWQNLNSLPHPRKDIVGLLNLRGEVLPIVNLENVLESGLEVRGVASSVNLEYRYIVVGEMGKYRFGFEVQEMHSIAELDESSFQVLKNIEGKKNLQFVNQICQYDQKMVLILNLKDLVTAFFEEAIQTSV